MDDPLAHLLEPGLELNKHQRYVLERELGHGAMGVVYAARDRLLDRAVAVKVMAGAAVPDAELHKYFEREARAAARLSHRNVVVVHDFGYDPRGAPFVVMERLRGFDLRQGLAGGQVPPLEKRLAVMMQVLAGLAHAHAAGVVHRDVKPANVFLTEEGVVKLLDFGIARLAQAGSAGLGSSHGVMGTADYMSPEQVLGADDLDTRSDIFSSGALLFELLTGRPPFHAESFVTIAYRIVHEAPDYALVPAAAATLLPVLKRALAKDRALRFESALDFATEIALAGGVGVAPDTIQASAGWNVPLPFPRPPRLGTTVRLRKGWDEGPTRPLDPAALPAWPLRAPEEDHEAGEPGPLPARRGRRSGARLATMAVAATAAAAALAFAGWRGTRAAAPAPVLVAPPGPAEAPAPAVTPAPAGDGAPPSAFQSPGGLSADAPLIPPAATPAPVATAAPVARPIGEGVRASADAPRTARPLRSAPAGAPAPAPQAPAPAARTAAPRVMAGRWTGFLTDEKCREKGAVNDHGSCLGVCLRHGARAMILIDGELYWLTGIDRIRGLNDRRVVVEGRLDLDQRTLTVASGAPAR